MLLKNVEKNDRTQITVPDQGITIKDLIDRMSNGVPIATRNHKSFTPVYDADNPVRDPRSLDLSEIHEIRKTTRLRVKELESQVKQQEKEAEKLNLREELEREKAELIEQASPED